MADELDVTQSGLTAAEENESELDATQSGLIAAERNPFVWLDTTQAGLAAAKGNEPFVDVVQAGLIAAVPIGPSEPLPPTTEVELWSDYYAAGGDRLAILSDHESILSGRYRLQIDRDEELTFTIPVSSTKLPEVQLGRVIRVSDGIRPVTWWRLTRREDGRGVDTGTVIFAAASPHADLARALLRTTIAGGSTLLGVTAELTPRQWIEQVIIPALEAEGIDWVVPGTVQFEQPLSYELAQATPLLLMNQIQADTGGEWRLEEGATIQGPAFVLSLYRELGAGAPERLMMFGRNVLHLQRDEEHGPTFGSVVVPVGLVSPADNVSATIAEAVWRVVDVDAGNSTIDLAAPDGGDGPAQFGDQFNLAGGTPTTHWLWIEALAATRAIVATEVLTPEVTRLELDDVAGIGAGMIVGLRAGADGTRMWELEHPDFSRPPDGRRVVRTWSEPNARGERNYLPNSFFGDWPGADTGRVLIGQWNQTTSWQVGPIGGVAVTGLPPDTEIPFSSWILGQGVRTWHRVLLTTVTDGSGNATLLIQEQPVVDGQVSSIVTGESFTLYLLPPPPAGALFGPTPTLTPDIELFSLGRLFQWRDRSAHGILAGGTVTAATPNSISISGLPPGELIQPGDLVAVTVSGDFEQFFPVAGTVQTTGGVVTIPMRSIVITSIVTFAARVIRPGGQREPGSEASSITPSNAVVLPSTQRFMAGDYSPASNLGAAGYDGPAGGIRLTVPAVMQADTARPSIWAHVGYTLVGHGRGARIAADIGPSPVGLGDTHYRPASLSITSLSSTAEASALALDAERTLGRGQVLDVVLRVQHQFFSDDRFQVAFNGPVMEGVTLNGVGNAVTTIVRYLMLTLGSDPAVPPFDVVSLATLLHQRGNVALKAMVIGERYIRLTLRDAAAMPGFVSADELLTLGGRVRLFVTDFLDLTVRVVAIIPDLIDRANTAIIVDALPSRLLPILPPGVRR